MEDLVPWCVVTFDSMERPPAERISMLKDMGFTKYGYEMRSGYPFYLKEEIELAYENGIEITSVFLWLNAKRDSIGKLSSVNKRILNILEDSEAKPTLWLSMSQNYFEGLDEEKSMKLALEYVRYIKDKANDVGCKIALYNHHGWFGNPYHQVEIIDSFNRGALTMVFNFHHAHDYIDHFPAIVSKIKPYLSHVNINGMKKHGPQILTVGDGDFEYQMVKTLLDEGYEGSWGILGHVESEDVQKVLSQNDNGFNRLISKYEIELDEAEEEVL